MPSAGRWRAPRPVFRVNRQFAQFLFRIFGEFDEKKISRNPLTSFVSCDILVSSKERSKTKMTIAIIIISILLSFQFVTAIEKDCMGLAVMFGVEIILFAYIAKNFI